MTPQAHKLYTHIRPLQASSMDYPIASHDVWCAVLDILDSWSLLMTCNLVCSAWHAHLRSRLMSSMCLDYKTYPLSQKNALILKQCANVVRRLRLVTGDGQSEWQPGFSLSPMLFVNVETLELYQITFWRVEDLQKCISAMSATLKNLIIFECSCLDVKAVKSLLEDRQSQALPTHPSHDLALRRIEIDSDQSDLFACAFWDWFATSPTPGVLRFLDIRLGSIDENDLSSLLSFLSHRACLVEEVDMYIGK
jgi:hypothetical protein